MVGAQITVVDLPCGVMGPILKAGVYCKDGSTLGKNE